MAHPTTSHYNFYLPRSYNPPTGAVKLLQNEQVGLDGVTFENQKGMQEGGLDDFDGKELIQCRIKKA